MFTYSQSLLSHDVVTTVRSDEKGRKIRDYHSSMPESRLSYVIVKDIAQDGSFDQAVVSDPPFEAVIHTASPFHFNVTDAQKDMLDPAINGTTEILKAIKAKSPTVKKMVITSSFAAIINDRKHPESYSEEIWNPVTMEEALANPKVAYRASKTFAEKAAWDFVRIERPNFQVATINPPLVIGPVLPYLVTLDTINTSNERIREMIQGKIQEPLSPTDTFLWVDVRDVATAHIQAMELPGASGKRFFVTKDHISNEDIADCIRKRFSELSSKLPAKSQTDKPAKRSFGFNNSRSVEVLGLKYRSLNESVTDTVKSLQILGA